MEKNSELEYISQIIKNEANYYKTGSNGVIVNAYLNIKNPLIIEETVLKDKQIEKNIK